MAYRFYIKRAYDICSGVYLNDELNKIKEIAGEKDFLSKFISKLSYGC